MTTSLAATPLVTSTRDPEGRLIITGGTAVTVVQVVVNVGMVLGVMPVTVDGGEPDQWLALRVPQAAHIASWELGEGEVVRPPRGVTHVVLDTPAGLHDRLLTLLETGNG